MRKQQLKRRIIKSRLALLNRNKEWPVLCYGKHIVIPQRGC